MGDGVAKPKRLGPYEIARMRSISAILQNQVDDLLDCATNLFPGGVEPLSCFLPRELARRQGNCICRARAHYNC